MSDKAPEIVMLAMSNYIRPDIVEVTSKDWVLNGKNNSFYQYTIDRFNGSPTNAAIINSYVDLIYGKGLRAKNANTPQGLKDWTKLKTILLKKDLRMTIYDFELFGQASMDVIEKNSKDLSSISHISQNLIAPSIENDDCEIDNYWFSKDWSKYLQAKNKPVAFPAFDGKQKQSIYSIKPYKAGKKYFADPDYLAGMPYAEMEEEIANLNINSIKNGLSAGYIINVPDGINLTTEQRNKFKKSIEAQLTGSPNASRFVMSWNGRDVEITITPFPVNDNIHKQWQFLTAEARQQLLTAHRVTSPMLFGIKDNTGFGNNAEELDTAEAQLMKRVIAPKQAFIIDALEDILTAYNINLDLEFIPLSEPKTEVAAPVQMSNHLECSEDGATEDMANELISFGEDTNNEEWVLLCSADVDYNTDEDLFGLLQFANTGTARPNAKSKQDSEDIKIRYRYVDQRGKGGSKGASGERTFCKMMLSADKLYRKEDILQMKKSSTNPGFGKGKGGKSSYSIWEWKGGGKISASFPNGTCKHKWQREIYLNINGGVDVNSPLAKTISTSEARRKGYKVPTNDSDVSVTPNRNKS
jgi:hypothetical protein